MISRKPQPYTRRISAFPRFPRRGVLPQPSNRRRRTAPTWPNPDPPLSLAQNQFAPLTTPPLTTTLFPVQRAGQKRWEKDKGPVGPTPQSARQSRRRPTRSIPLGVKPSQTSRIIPIRANLPPILNSCHYHPTTSNQSGPALRSAQREGGSKLIKPSRVIF